MLTTGEVGWLAASIKNIENTQVGDTITHSENPALEPLPGYKRLRPMVFCGLYPIESAKYNDLRDALQKLKLNDSALEFEPETSHALGFGFRCGFLGLLHMEIIEERLEREYNLNLIATAPSVNYRVHLNSGEIIDVDNPAKMPEQNHINYIEEPYVQVSLMSPSDYIGEILEVCQSKRGTYVGINYLNEKRVNILYKLPLSEIVYDFLIK